MLMINNLSYTLHNKLIFNNISAAINDGEIAGITGATGSGKNFLIDLLRNKKSNYDGTIFIDKNNTRTVPGKIMKKLISHYSSIQNNVNPEAIVKEWILGGRINHKKRLNPYTDIDKEIAYRAMTLFGLDQFAETRLKFISDTSKKMASLARAFSAQSDILLLEKPEAGLNINQRILLARALKKYTSTGNKIIILTSSDLNFIAASCDRIFVLADNCIAETGTHRIITEKFIKKYFGIEAVVTKNIYSGLPEVQIIDES